MWGAIASSCWLIDWLIDWLFLRRVLPLKTASSMWQPREPGTAWRSVSRRHHLCPRSGASSRHYFLPQAIPTASTAHDIPFSSCAANSVFSFDFVRSPCSHFDITPFKSVFWWINEWMNEWMRYLAHYLIDSTTFCTAATVSAQQTLYRSCSLSVSRHVLCNCFWTNKWWLCLRHWVEERPGWGNVGSRSRSRSRSEDWLVCWQSSERDINCSDDYDVYVLSDSFYQRRGRTRPSAVPV